MCILSHGHSGPQREANRRGSLKGLDSILRGLYDMPAESSVCEVHSGA